MSSVIMNLSTALIVIAIAALLSLLLTRDLWQRRVIVLLAVILSLTIPVIDSNPWLWVNGAVGELSVLSIALLAGFIMRKLAGVDILSSCSRLHLYIFILISGGLLYPATLGLTQSDPYVLGYGFEIPLLVLAISVLYWIRKQHQLAILLFLVVALHAAGLYTSTNLWDYLIDPLLWIFSPVLLIIVWFVRRKQVVNTGD